MSEVPPVLKMSFPACPYCHGTKFVRLQQTEVTARDTSTNHVLQLALFTCAKCGKTDLFALDLPAFLARVPHAVVDVSGEGPYR